MLNLCLNLYDIHWDIHIYDIHWFSWNFVTYDIHKKKKISHSWRMPFGSGSCLWRNVRVGVEASHEVRSFAACSRPCKRRFFTLWYHLYTYIDIDTCVYIDINMNMIHIYIQLVGGFKHEFYFPFHLWHVILPIDELHHFSRWLLHHQPVMITSFSKGFPENNQDRELVDVQSNQLPWRMSWDAVSSGELLPSGYDSHSHGIDGP